MIKSLGCQWKHISGLFQVATVQAFFIRASCVLTVHCFIRASCVLTVHWRRFRDLKQVIEPCPVPPLSPRAQGRLYSLASYNGGPSHWQLQHTSVHIPPSRRRRAGHTTTQSGAPRWWGALQANAAGRMMPCQNRQAPRRSALGGAPEQNAGYAAWEASRREISIILIASFLSCLERPDSREAFFNYCTHCLRCFEPRTASKCLNRIWFSMFNTTSTNNPKQISYLIRQTRKWLGPSLS